VKRGSPVLLLEDSAARHCTAQCSARWLLLLLGEGAAYTHSLHTQPTHTSTLQDLYCNTGGEDWTCVHYNYMQGVKWDFGSAPCSGGNGTGSGDPCVDSWYVHNHTHTQNIHIIFLIILPRSIICHHLLGTRDGVTCNDTAATTAQACSVRELSLGRIGLKPQRVPARLAEPPAQRAHPVHLFITWNEYLRSSIPSSIGDMSALRYLNLKDTTSAAAFPPHWAGRGKGGRR
jgi:hypothetical protein